MDITDNGWFKKWTPSKGSLMHSHIVAYENVASKYRQLQQKEQELRRQKEAYETVLRDVTYQTDPHDLAMATIKNPAISTLLALVKKEKDETATRLKAAEYSIQQDERFMAMDLPQAMAEWGKMADSYALAQRDQTQDWRPPNFQSLKQRIETMNTKSREYIGRDVIDTGPLLWFDN